MTAESRQRPSKMILSGDRLVLSQAKALLRSFIWHFAPPLASVVRQDGHRPPLQNRIG
jgi:hypothetical protein